VLKGVPTKVFRKEKGGSENTTAIKQATCSNINKLEKRKYHVKDIKGVFRGRDAAASGGGKIKTGG